jgi:hypothetical protein
VITATASGSGELIDDGVNGVLVPIGGDGDDAGQVGSALAAGVARALPHLPEWSRAGHARATGFSIGAHADAAGELVDSVAEGPARPWPAERPAAFGGRGGAASGSVPPGGAERLGGLLSRLPAGRVLVHGTGRHTIELAGVLAAYADRVVAFADDDPARHGTRLWNWAVVAPAGARETGASDVVISSWINQEAIWLRRGVYEREGLRVHRLYGAEPSAPRRTPMSA